MKTPPSLIQQGIDALARTKEAGAAVPILHYDLHMMSPEDIIYHTKHALTRELAPLVEEMAHRDEVIEFADRQLGGDMNTVTRFEAQVVLMKPADYRFLCALMRDLKREAELANVPSVGGYDV